MNPGDRIGPYEIVAPLGVGGMGEVYRARDPQIGRDLAIKILPKSFADNEERLARFTREARTAGTLNHPNLVTVFELGSHEGAPFMAMELLEGETLRKKLGTGDDGSGPHIPQRKALDYSMQIARGLAAAHERGVVHRDIKPENIIITDDGRVKILDFGLAKLNVAPADEQEKTLTQGDRHKTSPGVVLGTAGYMSPEQVRGQAIDSRTDIFSFGTVLYEMLSGRRPFEGASTVETMNAVLRHDPPEISTDELRVPQALSKVVLRCLEKDREQRFQSARDLAFALEAIEGSTMTTSTRAAALDRPRPIAKFALIAAALLALAAAAFFAGRRTTVAPTAPAIRDVTQLTFQAGLESEPSISRDGKNFVFVSSADGDADIYLQRVGGRNAINLTPESPATDTEPAISPDGNLIAFSSTRNGNGIYVMGATGESVRRLTDFGFHPAWSPDSKKIVFCTEEVASPTGRSMTSELWVVDVEGGAKKKIFAGDAVNPSWSGDGKRIAFWAVGKGARRDIFTIAADGGTPVAVTDDAALDFRPAWAPNGNDLYFISDRGGTYNLWRVAVDASGHPRGGPQEVTLPAASVASIALSNDSVIFSAPVETMTIDRYSVDPTTLIPTGPGRPVFAGTMLIRSFDLSSDGQWIAFTTEGKQEDLFVVRSDGTKLQQLTSDSARDRAPRWSKDGSRLAFYSNRSGNYEIWSVRPDASDLEQLTHGSTQNNWHPQWSPDQKRVAFSGPAGASIMEVGAPSSTTAFPMVSPDEIFAPTSWSSSDRYIAGDVTSRNDDRPAAIFDTTTKTYTRLPANSLHPEWLGDERDLVYLDSARHRLVRYEFATSKAIDLPYASGSRIQERGFAISADRRSLFTATLKTEADIWLARLNNGAQ